MYMSSNVIVMQADTPTKRTLKSHTLYPHTHTQPHTCPLTIPMHVFIPLTNHSSVTISPLYTHVYTLYMYLEDRHKYCRVAGVYMYIYVHVQLPSVCKHIGSVHVCNFLLSDITGRLMAHCRTVSGHLNLCTCTLIYTVVTHTCRWIPTAQAECV